jgi:TRAP-type uncharacterized transport system substrate-binding protein
MLNGNRILSLWIFGLFALLTLAAGASSGMAQGQAGSALYQEKKDELNQNTITLMGGPISGTIAALAQDIQTVLDEPGKKGGLRILPIQGVGTGPNTQDLLFLRGIDTSIIQQDILEHFKQENPTLYGSIYNRIHYIAKIYNSEFHLLVKQDIKKWADLEGKKVSFFTKGSNADTFGAQIFNTVGVKVQKTYYALDDSIQKLREGELSAVVYVAGAPISAFNTKVKPEDNMRFLALDPETLPPGAFEKVLQAYLPAGLSSEAYPRLVPAGQKVATVASGVVLAAYNWPENSERYRRVAKFVEAFFDKFEEFLKPPRHEKWKETNLAADVPRWTRFKAAQEWLDKHKQSSAAETKAQFERFLQTRPVAANDAAPQDREQLFKEFMKWRENQKGGLTSR